MSTLAQALRTSAHHRFTLSDVFKLQDAGIVDADARLELIDGALLEMPVETLDHTRMKAQLVRGLFKAAGDAINVIVGGTLSLSPYDAPSPDFFLYDAELALTSIDGPSVGLVIEVAGVTTDRDLMLKAELYGRYGVRDYWVVDVEQMTTTIHRAFSDGLYRDVSIRSANEELKAAVLADLTINLAGLRPIL